MVLKTEQDRPVEPSTNELFGLIHLNEPFCDQTDIELFKPTVEPSNRINRLIFCKPATP